MPRAENGDQVKFLFTPILVFILILIVGWYGANEHATLLKQRHQNSLEKELTTKASALERIIQHRFTLLYGIRAYILANSDQIGHLDDNSDADSLKAFLKETYATYPDIREIMVSPGGTHRYVYPETEKTQKTLGHNLLTDNRPHVRQKVLQTIESGTIGLSGPYPLRQDGSLGLVARLPIYQGDQFWGFTAMILNVPKMLMAADLEGPGEFALRVSGGDLFWGDVERHADNPLMASVSLPDGKWDILMLSTPSGLSISEKVALTTLITLIALLASSLYFFLASRRWYLQVEVDKTTKELREQEVALRESESRYRSLFENNHSIMLLIDPETAEIVDANPPACGYYGYDRETLVQMKITEINQLTQQQVFEEMNRAKEEKRKSFNFRHCLASGEIRDVEVFSGPLLIEGRQLLYSIIYDITERKKAENTLREAEERFRLIFKMSPDPVILARYDDGAIIDINKAFETTIGIERHKAIGRNSEELNLWKDPGLREPFRERLLSQGEVNDFEAGFLLPDGEVRSGLFSARLLKINNELCLLVVLRDVTNEKAAKQALIQMDQAKNEFISMAAHELRTPLSAMMGFTELLLNPEIGNFKDEEKREFLGEVYDRGESLSRIIDDLLDISHIESGHSVSLEVQKCDFRDVLVKTVDFFRGGNSGHTFSLDMPEEGGESMMLIDRHRIKQVFENLLSNAVKYSPKESEITLMGNTTEEGWVVRVQDQGIGMTAEQIDRIFDKFYRADSSNTSVQGLGLGMSIVKQIVDGHGGKILVESEKGKGTIITCTLPCAVS